MDSLRSLQTDLLTHQQLICSRYFKDSMKSASETWTFGRVASTLKACAQTEDDFFVVLDVR